MLETIAVILLILWLLGLVTSYTMGGFIHILLVIAVVVILASRHSSLKRTGGHKMLKIRNVILVPGVLMTPLVSSSAAAQV